MSASRFCAVFLLLAAVALAQRPLQCSVASTTPAIRSAGITETVGDLVLSCTGGVAAANNQPVQGVNLQLFLNTAVTSRLIGDLGESEAILLVDEPSSGFRGNQLLCAPGQTILGTGDGASTYDGSAPHHCNVFRGQQAGDKSLAWFGLPFDPPGNSSRILRIKNVRVNASKLAEGLPVETSISVSPPSSIPLSKPSIILALVRRGFVVDFSQDIELDLHQCGSVDSDASNYSVTVSEGFASAFRRRSWAIDASRDTSPAPIATPDNSSVDTAETAFYNPAVLGSQTGLADAGTRIAVRFTGAVQSALLAVPLLVELKSGSLVTGLLRLVETNASGNGPFRAATSTEITVDGDTAQAVYEVLLANPFAIETATIPIRIGCDPAGKPREGQASVTVMLASLSDVALADKAAPVPRFQPAGETSKAYTRSLAGCALLFPYVNNQGAFDTGIAISNTSLDPLGTPPEAGSVTLNYYGTASGGGAPPRPQVSAAVPGGSTLTFTLSNGGNYGVEPVPGFQGYIIAQAGFGFCHGAAFLFNLGASPLADAYLGLVLKSAGKNRTSAPESLLH